MQCVKVKNQHLSKVASELLSSLEIKTPLSKIFLVGPLLVLRISRIQDSK